MALANRGSYYFGEFQLDMDLRVLVREGKRVSLGPKAYDVLSCLAANPQRVVSKNDLLKTVWADAHVEEATLTQHVFSLRKALGDQADLIVTVPGQGYRLNADVHHVDAMETSWPKQNFVHELVERARVVVEEPVAPRWTIPSSWPRYLALSAAVLAVAGLGGWMWSTRTKPADHVSLVVADFVNTTGDAAFDRTLLRALQIDLEQSPFIDVMSDKEGASTLGMMGRPNDTPLTTAVAREICVRTNRHVLLSGAISRIGGQYLLTLEASDCKTGKRLASAKAQTEQENGVLASLDTVAARVRSKLGESAQSIAQYEVPVSVATTSSLEALQAYSTVSYLRYHGPPMTIQQRLPFFQKAVELDPQFALAYVGISSCYYELLEPIEAAKYMQKAFDLRDRVTAKERLIIEASYYSMGPGADMLKSIETYHVWAASYPREWAPWLNMANLYNELGLYPEAIAAGQKAYQLEPSSLNAVVLARAYKNAGRFAEAKQLGAQLWSTSGDSGGLTRTLSAIAYYEHDDAAFAREVKWGEDTKIDLRNYQLAMVASMDGRYKKSEDYFAAEVREDEQGNLNEVKDGVLVDEAEVERESGLPDQAKKSLARMTPGSLDMPDVAFEHAIQGDVAYAERYLAKHGNDPHPPGSYLGYMWFPLLRSELALRHGQLQEALTALDPSLPNQMKGSEMRMQRARVLMALHQPDKAAEVYRNILDTPGSVFSINYPMAQLGLARAYAAAGDTSDSRAAYDRFFVMWKDADSDLPVLKAAHDEAARL